MSSLAPRLTAFLVVALLAIPAASAVAGPPSGDWTRLRADSFVHYACKAKAGPKAKGKWRLRTATWINGREEAIDAGIGAYGALARGSNENVVAERTETAWRGGYIRMSLNGALADDRLWVQGAYYGPPRPWTKGVPVSRITRC